MRFLFNDSYILEMSLELVFEGIRVMTQGSAEKEKMRSNLRFLMSNFMTIENIK